MQETLQAISKSGQFVDRCRPQCGWEEGSAHHDRSITDFGDLHILVHLWIHQVQPDDQL